MPDPVVTRPVAGAKRRAIRRFRVTVTSGPTAGATWNATAERCSIGSHPSNDLVIDDPTVSRFHCELAIAGDVVRVRDLGSRNGTLAGRVGLADGTVPAGTILASRITGDTPTSEPKAVRSEVASSACEASTSIRSWLLPSVFGQLEKIAASDATVLIEGETGTGKEGVAEAIHDESARAKAPFIVVDCGAIPANLLESELFGHEAGAFTGANERRIGVFEQASGGTIFLDEIGELPAELQPKLLRALEAREIRRVGGRTTIKCDLRIISATNRDLRAEVNKGTFRADLYYRLAVVKVELPPLRERTSDMPVLVEHLLHEIGASPKMSAALTSPEFVTELAAAPWVGNVRELRNHLEQCVVFEERRSPGALAVAHPSTTVDASRPYEVARRQAIDTFERAYVTALLERNADNVAADAGCRRESRVPPSSLAKTRAAVKLASFVAVVVACARPVSTPPTPPASPISNAKAPAPEPEPEYVPDNTCVFYDKLNPACRMKIPGVHGPEYHATKCSHPADPNSPGCEYKMPCPNPPDPRIIICNKTPPDVAGPLIGRVVQAQPDGDALRIGIALGWKSGVSDRWRAEVLDGESDRPLAVIEVTSVEPMMTRGRVKLSRDVLLKNMRVRMTRLP